MYCEDKLNGLGPNSMGLTRVNVIFDILELLFQNIAYLGLLKHLFATRLKSSASRSGIQYMMFNICISALSLYIRHLYISPSPPDGFPHVANSQLKQGLRGRFLQLQVWVLEKKIGLGQLRVPNIRSNGY